jgi:hypothetical protein
MRELLQAARAVGAFLARETGLRVHAPSWDEARGAVVLPFESVAGRRHVIAFAEAFLTDRSQEEIEASLRESWVPDHMKHPDYQALLVTNEGVENL